MELSNKLETEGDEDWIELVIKNEIQATSGGPTSNNSLETGPVNNSPSQNESPNRFWPSITQDGPSPGATISSPSLKAAGTKISKSSQTIGSDSTDVSGLFYDSLTSPISSQNKTVQNCLSYMVFEFEMH